LRFIGALAGLETANRTLEARVLERERQIAASYERIASLQREQAATDERQRIMRDLHDGLGSQLFTSLSRSAPVAVVRRTCVHARSAWAACSTSRRKSAEPGSACGCRTCPPSLVEPDDGHARGKRRPTALGN
jgi:hypothetical protein